MRILHFLPVSLRTRFIVGMAIMFLPLVVLGIGAFFSLQSTVGAFDQVVKEVVDGMVPIVHLQILVMRASKPSNDYIIHGDPAERERFVLLSREVDQTFEEALAAPFALKEYQTMVQVARDEWQQAQTVSKAILTVPQERGNSATPGEMKRLETHINHVVGTLDQIHYLLHREINKRLALAHAAKRRILLIIVSVFGVALGASVLAGTALARSILLPLKALEEGADRFGEGNLSHRVTLITKDELGQLARGFNAMAEKLEKSQAALQYLSIRDDLTGLYNRRHFHLLLKDEVERWRRYGRPFSLLMLDIDHFKAINDTYGHQAGDEALRTAAALVNRAVRPVDRVCRYGGEEFAIILSETSSSGGLAMAERILEVMGTQTIFVDQGQAVNLTVSIGAASFPEDARSEDDLIISADRALYAAKHAGRNRVSRPGRS